MIFIVAAREKFSGVQRNFGLVPGSETVTCIQHVQRRNKGLKVLLRRNAVPFSPAHTPRASPSNSSARIEQRLFAENADKLLDRPTRIKHHGGECMFRKIYPLILLTSSLAVPAGIQAQEMKPNHMPTPNFDLYGGYSYVFTEHGTPPGTITTSGTNGWDASLKVPLFTSWLGIKGDVSGVYNNDNSPNFSSKTTYFLLRPAGLRASWPIHFVRPWHGG